MEFSRVYDNSKCPYEKSLETYRMHLVYIYIFFFFEECKFRQQVMIQASFVKDDGTSFIYYF